MTKLIFLYENEHIMSPLKSNVADVVIHGLSLLSFVQKKSVEH